jgi:uncharacterized membrane protein
MSRPKRVVLLLMALAMIGVGIIHFANPEPFVRIVPPVLPAPLALVYFTGACEIAGGLGLLWSRTRWLAAMGLVVFYVAVFPANINMAVNHLQMDPVHPAPEWVAWARLPFQALFIGVAYWLSRGGVDAKS